VHASAVEMIRASRAPIQQQGGGGYGGGYGHQPAMTPSADSAPIIESLSLLPLYAMSLQKSLVIRGGIDVRLDERYGLGDIGVVRLAEV
jgi:hypothetical protein